MEVGTHRCHMIRCSHKDSVRKETFDGIQSCIQNFQRFLTGWFKVWTPNSDLKTSEQGSTHRLVQDFYSLTQFLEPSGVLIAGSEYRSRGLNVKITYIFLITSGLNKMNIEKNLIRRFQQETTKPN